MLRLILQENSFHFNEKTFSKHTELQWEQKWQFLLQTCLWWKLRPISSTKVLTNHSFGSKRQWQHLFSKEHKEAVNNFTEQMNSFHPTIKFTAEISDTEITFLEYENKQNKQTRKRILPFVTEYRPSMPDLKHILMKKWHLIQNQPRKIFKNPPLISDRKGRSLKDVLVRAKLWGLSISYLDQ